MVNSSAGPEEVHDGHPHPDSLEGSELINSLDFDGLREEAATFQVTLQTYIDKGDPLDEKGFSHIKKEFRAMLSGLKKMHGLVEDDLLSKKNKGIALVEKSKIVPLNPRAKRQGTELEKEAFIQGSLRGVFLIDIAENLENEWNELWIQFEEAHDTRSSKMMSVLDGMKSAFNLLPLDQFLNNSTLEIYKREILKRGIERTNYLPGQEMIIHAIEEWLYQLLGGKSKKWVRHFGKVNAWGKASLMSFFALIVAATTTGIEAYQATSEATELREKQTPSEVAKRVHDRAMQIREEQKGDSLGGNQ